MSETAYICTVEGAHQIAKEKGISPWALGCSCNECNSRFERIMEMKDDSLSDVHKMKPNKKLEHAQDEVDKLCGNITKLASVEPAKSGDTIRTINCCTGCKDGIAPSEADIDIMFRQLQRYKKDKYPNLVKVAERVYWDKVPLGDNFILGIYWDLIELDDCLKEMFQTGISAEMIGVKDDRLTATKVNQSKLIIDQDCQVISVDVSSVFEREVWNDAIETAIKQATNAIGYQKESSLAAYVASQIRKLKK